jgi:molecular chaperone GrpE (heat shock protein)
MRQQLLSALPQFVMRQDWEALSGQLHKAEVGRRDLRATVITKIIEVIFDMETMYGAPPSDGGYEPADEHASKFEMAIRATVNRLESILRDEFNIERIPIQRNTIFDPRCMEADRHEETPPSSDMAGNVAHVIAPGYWIPLADGDTELYRRAKVRRFKGGRR